MKIDSTYVFASPSAPHGPLAIGSGDSKEQAMTDALTRLDQRCRGSLMDEPTKRLADSLSSQQASLVARRPGSYIQQVERGHDYVSNETQMAAVTFASSSAHHQALAAKMEEMKEARSRLKRLGGDDGPNAADAEVTRALFGPKVRLEMGPYVDVRFIDWHEVAQEFGLSVESEPEEDRRGLDQAHEVTVDALSTRRIDDDVLTVLRQCEVDGHNVRLPSAKLDRKLYERVNAVLTALGGKWVGRKVQAHVFPEPPGPLIEIAVGTGKYLRPQDWGYFPTPDDLADKVIEMAGIRPGMKVLEPSAGAGALATRAVMAAGGDFDQVTVAELLPANAQRLRQAGWSFVNQCDFLTLTPAPIFDVVVMNPPFGGSAGPHADVDHVNHALNFLKPTGRLVAITSPSWERTSARKAQAFRALIDESEAQVVQVSDGTFRESGTNVATRIVQFEAAKLPINRARHSISDLADEATDTPRERERERG